MQNDIYCFITAQPFHWSLFTFAKTLKSIQGNNIFVQLHLPIWCRYVIVWVNEPFLWDDCEAEFSASGSNKHSSDVCHDVEKVRHVYFQSLLWHLPLTSDGHYVWADASLSLNDILLHATVWNKLTCSCRRTVTMSIF